MDKGSQDRTLVSPTEKWALTCGNAGQGPREHVSPIALCHVHGPKTGLEGPGSQPSDAVFPVAPAKVWRMCVTSGVVLSFSTEDS